VSALLISSVLALAQTGADTQPIGGFWSGAGRAVGIVVAVLVAGVLVAMIRAGGSRK